MRKLYASVSVLVAIACFAGDASALRNARVAAATGFPLPNPPIGQTAGTLADGLACFSTTAWASGANGGNGAIKLSGATCRGSSSAFWVMPIASEERSGATTITAYVVTTGSPTLFVNVFDYAGTFSTGSGAVTASSSQTAVTSNFILGGYANVFAQLSGSSTVFNYAYSYDY